MKGNNDTPKGVLMMVFSSVCVCFGQLLWKISVGGNIYALLGGVVLYGMGALSMLLAYRYGRLSVLQPILSLNYVLSLLLGALVLNETISFSKGAGIVIIITGLILITREK